MESKQPKRRGVEASRRRRRPPARGEVWGYISLPIRLEDVGSVVSSISGVRGGLTAEIDFHVVRIFQKASPEKVLHRLYCQNLDEI